MLIESRPSEGQLQSLLSQRLALYRVQKLIDQAHEVVIFGSVAASLDRANSDLDVLVVSDQNESFKSEKLDIVAVSLATRDSNEWMTSELASHIKKYGVWLSGSRNWGELEISQRAIDLKARRIRTFLRSLPRSWDKLDDVFKTKYATKIRRETQRLILLESKEAIPPTRLIDEEWCSRFGTERNVVDRLADLNVGSESFVFDEIRIRISKHLSGVYRESQLRHSA